MQSDTTTPPKRIWAEETGMATKGGQRFRIGRWIIDETASHPHEYILASEVAALIAEAEARGMERAAELALSCGIAVNANQRDAIAAAIRAAKGEPT